MSLQIDAEPVSDPAYHFDADPDAEPDPDFNLMRMRIQVTKITKLWGSGFTTLIPTRIFHFLKSRVPMHERQ